MKKGLIMAVLLLIGGGLMAQHGFNYKLAHIKGGKKKISQFKGKVVYIDIWASWCAPCISNMPSLTSLEQEFGNDLEIITVSLDDSKRTWKKKYREYRPAGTALWGGKGGTESKFAKSLSVGSLPRYILIDRNGNMVNAMAEGPYRVKQQIRDLVGG